MKRNDIMTAIRHTPLPARVAATALLLQILLLCIGGVCTAYPDTDTYIYAADTLLDGHINVDRMPVYPLYLALCRAISAEAFPLIASLGQIICFTASIFLFNTVLRMAEVRRPVATVALWAYAMFPNILIMPLSLLTESLSISGMVCFLYLTLRIVRQRRTLQSGAALAVLVLLLVFMRPSFTYLLILAGIAAILMLCMRRGRGAVAFIMTPLLVSPLLWCYSLRIEQQTGAFSPSMVSVANDIISIFQYKMYRSSDVTNARMKPYMDRINAMEHPSQDFNVAMASLYSDFSEGEIKAELDAMRDRDPVRWYKMKLEKGYLSSLCFNTFDVYYDHIIVRVIHYLVYVPMSCIYYLLLISVIIFMRRYRRSTPYTRTVALLMLLVCFGQLAVNLLGSMNEWGRLFSPALPALTIIVSLLFSPDRAKGKTLPDTV